MAGLRHCAMLTLFAAFLLLCCVFSIPAVIVGWLASALHDFFDSESKLERAL